MTLQESLEFADKHLTPDVIAECYDGVGNNLYTKLWNCVENVPFSELPDNPAPYRWVHKLDEEDQKAVAEIVQKEFSDTP